MKNLLCIIIMSASTALAVYAQNTDNENLIVSHGPWLQNLTESGVTVMWTTNKPAIPGVKLITSDSNARLIRNSHDGIIDGGGILHKVRIEGLQPGTRYNYSLHSVEILKYQAYKIFYGDTLVSEQLNFATFPEKSENVRFTVVNDVHENSWKLAAYMKNGDCSMQDFFFFNGDMLEFLQEPDQIFTGFTDTAVSYFAKNKPFVYVRGNHETRGSMARDLKQYFDFNHGRYYFGFDYGPFHFTVLDCGEDKPDNNRYYYGLADYDFYRIQQLEWLKNEVKSDNFIDAKFRIVIIHMPIIKAENQGHGMRFLADHYGPILSNAGTNLLISAHTHRNAFYDKGESGFNYPVLVNSADTYIEVYADMKVIKATVRDLNGDQIAEYSIEP